jgi:lysine 2,3-aminomutase
MEIMEGLRGHMSGLGIPTYVVDSPHGGGKIPIMPNYILSAGNDAVILRNYEGQIVRYQAEDRPNTAEPTHTRGVSALLQGSKSALIPENSERMTRRRQLNVVTNGHDDDHGCCGGEEMVEDKKKKPLNVLANGCGS